jgi:hypothetical protein
MPGICTSMITRSGSCLRQYSIACRPVEAAAMSKRTGAASAAR